MQPSVEQAQCERIPLIACIGSCPRRSNPSSRGCGGTPTMMPVAGEGRGIRGSACATTSMRSPPGRLCSAIIYTAKLSGSRSSTARSVAGIRDCGLRVLVGCPGRQSQACCPPYAFARLCGAQGSMAFFRPPRLLREWAMTPLALSLGLETLRFGSRPHTSEDDSGSGQASGWHSPSGCSICGPGTPHAPDSEDQVGSAHGSWSRLSLRRVPSQVPAAC